MAKLVKSFLLAKISTYTQCCYMLLGLASEGVNFTSFTKTLKIIESELIGLERNHRLNIYHFNCFTHTQSPEHTSKPASQPASKPRPKQDHQSFQYVEKIGKPGDEATA